ncbi:hypothetical protein [Candidatus Enterococcus murrayae]|uniref:Uncharacterized protein n=1 Tax=Candidatus Enterococcus murrayae TaxID=2815321 RepID=A0ABS3HQB7_9ENTE|nr:hypothetical protein [Enterococcus sp. MJM16]MBO0455085.1 hypothetical protein [Enterococcus sp. MJM16]
MLNCIKKNKEQNYFEKYSITLKTVPNRDVLSIRKIVSSYENEHQLENDLHAEFVKQDVKMANPPSGMTIYHDKEYKESDVDIEIQSNIIGQYQDTDEVKFYNAPEFIITSVIFNGDFNQMPNVTQALAS